MLEIRWHGRGGQGVVTAAKILAAASLREKKYFQAFPEFGPERRGAPLQAFTRIDTIPIRIYSHVTMPDAVVVVDDTLIGHTPLTEGLSEESLLIVNYNRSPGELRSRLKMQTGRLFTVRATEISLANIGRPVTNTAMLGALLSVCPAVSCRAVEEEICYTLAGKIKPELLEANILSFKEAFREVKGE
ncbi:MAG: 2-oxoacid:acceptor oxidoreductase family protein [bacterium]|jgi:pyruvate ferredoxin oxidoreductase gamma subunit|nr:2-oxoacid:acceptor oxidoreductase family protein [bacterium]MDD3805889.1 2-oxoacid:acceptor oxidoreductase family protein [bacterium]MDD4153249.1 2-oxoacid:acceptor oxidoreductase family protein [bacterium]MDD4558336.1 2-oxoacid:acceptor oxidoreductase family protein [bacterium]